MTTVVTINVDTAQKYQDTFEKAYDLPTNAELDATLTVITDEIEINEVSAAAVKVKVDALPTRTELNTSLVEISDNTANIDASVRKINITKPNNIATAGDSLTDDGHGGTNWNDFGWTAWFRRVVNQNYIVDSVDNFAVGGTATEYLVNTQLPQILASGCGFCIVMNGINDIRNDIHSSEIIGRLDTFYKALSNSNIVAIALPIMPTDDGVYALSSSQKSQASLVNKWLSKRASVKTDMRYISVLDQMTDYSLGLAKASLFRDGLHTNKIGAQILGEKIATDFNDIYPLSSDHSFSIGGNVYDANENPNGNIFLNSYMIGSGGAAINAVTGTVSQFNEVRTDSASNTFSAVASIEQIGNKNWQVMTLSGTGDGDKLVFRADIAPITMPANWVVGDEIEGSMQVICENLTGIDYIQQKIGDFGSTSSDGSSNATNGAHPANFSGTYKVKGIISTGFTGVYIQLMIGTTDTEAVSGVIKVTDCTIVKKEKKATTLMNFDFEALPLPKTHGTPPVLSGDFAYEGTQSVKSSIDYAALTYNNRSEIQENESDKFANFSDVFEYEISTYLPASYVPDDVWEIIIQWHGKPDTDIGEDFRSPPLAITSTGGNYGVTNRWDSKRNTYVSGSQVVEGEQIWDLGAYTTGVWVDWKFEIKWSSRSDGILKIWKDGTLVVNKSGANCYNDDQAPYFKAGIYKGWSDYVPDQVTTRTIYHDALTIKKLLRY